MERPHWEVWLIGVIGLWLIVSPFVLGVPFAEEAGAGSFRWTFVGAGSVVTKPVAADELAIARGEQRGFAGWARRFRDKQRAKKESR